ncbi:MAG: YggT family protein [Clostridia bacterium]|nr:YggT family protein [Clostridia bacterium]
MTYALRIIADVVVLLLNAIQLAMLARAILSWLPIDSNKFIDFLYGLTEPFIYPIRALFQRMNWFQDLPIDIAFMVSYLLISGLSLILLL